MPILPDDFPIPPHVVTVTWQAIAGDVLLPTDYADWVGASLSVLVAAVHHPEALAAQQPDTDARHVAAEVLAELDELKLAACTAEQQRGRNPEAPTTQQLVTMQADSRYVRISPGSELNALVLDLEVFAKAVLRPDGGDARTARGALAYSAAAWSRELGLVTGALPVTSTSRGEDGDPSAAPEPPAPHLCL